MSKKHAVKIFGVPIDEYTTSEFIEQLEYLIKQPEQALVCPVNVDMLNQTISNEWLRTFISSADIIQAESSGVLLGARLLGRPLVQKITSNEIIYTLAKRWEDKEFSIYLLGGPEGQAKLAATKLHEQYPNFKIVGYHRGHLNEIESNEVIRKINEASPSILMVGFGCPIQEEWTDKYRASLNVPLLWPIGNLTSFVSGTVSTAPKWMKRYGFEWLYRLGQEPQRMWKRYIIGNPLFVFRVIWYDKW